VHSRPGNDEAALAMDATLDDCLGACWLRRRKVASLVERALLHFDGERYFLLAWCVMPNHVHVMLEMRIGYRLGDQVRSWKSFTSRRANERLHRTGAFWSTDYFDRFIRGDRHYEIALNYIEYNPVKAGLVASPELWAWSSARRR
jgi:REP element-mobilizing transposase RayT